MTLSVLPEIPPLDRFELYGMLGMHRVLEPWTEEFMQAENEREWRGDDIARGEWWNTSFHASEFPGDDFAACARFLTYKRMNFPPGEPMPPWVTTTGTVGKAGELDIARAWYHEGRSFAVPEDEDDGQQLVFEWRDYWLTGSTDLPILRHGDNKPHIVEIKCKADDVIDNMMAGTRQWDAKHRFQLLTSIGLANQHDWGEADVCRHCWRIVRADVLMTKANPDGQGYDSDAYGYCPSCKDYDFVTIQLEKPDSGSIYYWSRSWPRKTIEFYFKHDQDFMQAGLDVIAEAREAFENDRIPDRPAHFQWSLNPCGRCGMRSFCRLDSGLEPRKRKPDEKLLRTKLSESHGIEHAKTIYFQYDPEAARQRVVDRWNG